jgi:hypothetical protein
MWRPSPHMARCLWLALWAGVASAQGPAQASHGATIWPNLDPSARAVLYAPFAWDVDPLKGADLYDDARNATFRRDARLLREIGATTLVLEPSSSMRSRCRSSN